MVLYTKTHYRCVVNWRWCGARTYAPQDQKVWRTPHLLRFCNREHKDASVFNGRNHREQARDAGSLDLFSRFTLNVWFLKGLKGIRGD